MRLGPFCLHKPSLKLYLACALTFVITLYLFWSGCEVATSLPPTKLQEIRGVPQTVADCPKVITKVTYANKAEGEQSEEAEFTRSKASTDQNICPDVERIDAIVNGEKKFQATLHGGEAYVPFSFVKEYFDIYGELQEIEGKTVLDWRHSYSEVRTAKAGSAYETRGPFLWFETYHVEGRSRVKCVSGIEEVPVSTQWNPKGHYYPIQIAQYGLSHYNMLLLEGDSKEKRKVFEDAESVSDVTWNWATSQNAKMVNVFNKERNTRVLQFSTSDLSGEAVSLHLDSATKDFILTFDLLLRGEVRVSVVIETDNSVLYTVHYSTNNALISATESEVFYGLGRWKGWKRIVRSLDTDLRKGLALRAADKKKTRKSKLSLTEIQSIALHGRGAIDNISLAHSAHAHFFLAAANWFLRNQNEQGNWPITVKRVVESVTLNPNWYSAMAQGHGMSLLTRAYLYTKNEIYLNAALRATSLFKIRAKDKGLLATFMNQYPWYEEYPTSPSLFVLNGFIYSLLGLYDLKLTASPHRAREAAELFNQGMRSLKVMLPLYDSGSGSFYDLRHVTMHLEPNLARWDYHTLHVSLLYFLAGINGSDPIFKSTAVRWESYAKGKRAKHN